MSQLPLNAALSPKEMESIHAALQTIRQAMPFLVALTPLEKRRLFKIGIRAQTFVTQAIDVAEHYPAVVPACLDMTAARQTLTLFNDLTSILHSLKELSELVECTQTLAGSQVYASARLTYQSVKSVGPKLGLNPVVDSLSRQFQKARQRSVEAGADESSVTSG